MNSDQSLKLKNIKKPSLQSKTTLDAIHNQQLNTFRGDKDSLDAYKKELSELEKQLDTPECKNSYEIEKRCKLLRDKIKKINNMDDVYNYYLKTGNLLYEYYNVQDKISQGNITKTTNSKYSRPGTIFAALEEAATRDDSHKIDFDTVKEKEDDAVITAATVATATSNTVAPYARENILDKYLQIVDPEIAKNFITESEEKWSECPNCNKEMIFNMNEAYISCAACGYQDFVLIDSDKPSYKDPPREVSYYAYKRINHFNEWLAQFQAKESTEIPQEVFDAILFELKKERITNMATLKRSTLKEILKKIKFNKYEHIPHILNRLNGQNAPVMKREDEEKLRFMFKEIQPSFQKHRPEDRSNFLSYSFILYKFCELLELDEFLTCFPLLKNRDKLYMQDKIWQKICYDMGWEFIRTI
jgi:hypothetical protein